MAKTDIRRNPQPKLIALAVAGCFAAGTALANPSGHTVVSGQVTVNPMGNLLQITNSPNAIINWQSFSIGSNEITRFIQQSGSSAVLNRVTSQDPSRILGTLQSKLSDGVTTGGRVFLINPNGIVFGAGSQIDVGGFVASTLGMSDSDFLNGRMRFTDGLGKAVENYGNIGTTGGGHVYLVGAAVTNSGIITTPNGEVVLAAGNRVELVNPGTPNLRVEIVAPDNQARNLGQIVADSGRVGIYAGLINHSGKIRADGAQTTADGRIVLRATKNATLEAGSVTTANGRKGGTIEIQSGDTTLVAGKVEATGSAGKGGTVHVLGEQVGLVGDASIDVSGATGGGTVLVGGDFQGKNPAVQNALRTVIGSNASVAADAITRGNGGKVIVWSDEMTRAYGAISARGGRKSGDGGFVEVSSKGWLDFQGTADTRAPQGKTGTLLLDPNDVQIVNTVAGGEGGFSGGSGGSPFIFNGSGSSASQITWSTIEGNLDSADVIITTSGPGPMPGNITVVNDSPILNSSNKLQLVAKNDIDVNGRIRNDGSGEIHMFAGWNEADAVNPSVNNNGVINLNAPVRTSGNVVLVAGRSINQAVGAPVTADTLWAESVFRNVNMHLAPNTVTTLAGRSGDLFEEGSTFRFRNAQSLTIGSFPSRGSGVRVDGGEGNALARITTTAGSLTLNQQVTAQSMLGEATVELTAANALNINDFVEANGGISKAATIRFTAGAGGIRVDGGEGIRADGGNYQIEDGISGPGGAATITMKTTGGGDVLIRNTEVEADGGYGLNDNGGAAKVEFTSAGGITVEGTGSFTEVKADGGSAGASGGGTGSGIGGAASVKFDTGGPINVTNADVVATGGATDSTTASHAGGAASITFVADGSINVENAIFSIEALGGSAAAGRGGDSLIDFSAGGATNINNSTARARGGMSTGAEGSAGGSGRIVMRSDGTLTIEGFSEVEAVGGTSNSGKGGLGEISATAGNLIVRGASTVSADGGEGRASSSGRAGGAGKLSFLTPGNITVAGAEGGVAVGAFGGNGKVGGDADTVFAAGGAISIEDTNRTLTSDNGKLQGQGIFAVAGEGLHDGATGGRASSGMAADGSVSIARSHIEAIAGAANVVDGVGGTAGLGINSRDGSITIVGAAPGTVEVMGGLGQLQGGSAEGSLVAAGDVSVTGEFIGVFGGSASTGSGGTSTFAVGAGGNVHFLDTRVDAFSGPSANAVIGFLAGGSITVEQSESSISSNSIHAFAGSGAADRPGGSSSIHFKAVTGNIDIINEDVMSLAGSSFAGAGGNGTIVFDAAVGISSRDSHVEAAGGFGQTAGGKGSISFSARDRIEITSFVGGGTTTTPEQTVLASGGATGTDSGLGTAEIVMQILSSTGELVVQDDTVHALGGSFGEGGPFGTASIRLKFPGRTEGGFSVNGVAGAITGPSPSFGFLVNGETAIPGQNFFVEYGNPGSIFDAPVLAALDKLLGLFVEPAEDPDGKKADDKKKSVCD